MIFNAEDATNFACGPQAERGFCYGPKCAVWRWEPLLADEAFAAAVKKAEAETGMPHPKAAKHVTENRAQYGLPTKPFRGYCGLAGKP